jgi:DNA polymerase-3 subunit alpha
MQNLLTKLKPTCFSDLLVAIALFRPGPMDNIDLYIKNKNHPNLIKYPDNSLKDILKETNGIIVYQEQIMQILQFMADYSFAEADNIRRAMSKKKEEIILNEKENFISRSVDKGYQKDVAEDIYNLILKFADYGFNKAHSVAYALIGYEMAYLKANYPDKFIVANLNIFGKAQIKCREYLMEALKFHLKLHKPLINKSSSLFIIKGVNILLPFNQIVGISEEFSTIIFDERSNGEYKNIFDFVRRIPLKYLNKNNLEKLISADVFRTFGYNKKTLISNLDTILNYAEIANGLSDGEVEEPYLIIEKDYSDKELRLIEKEMYGFYISNHPSSAYQDKVVKIENANKYFDKPVNMVLVVENIDTFKTKKDETMASVLASDETGEIELIVFPKNIDQIKKVDVGDIILVKGNIGKRYNDYQVLVSTISKKNN